MHPQPPISTLFPYTTLFRSELTSAVFVARRLNGDSVRTALEHTAAAVHAVLKSTYEAGRYELELVAAQDDIARPREWLGAWLDRKSTRLNSSHMSISYAVFC